MSSGLGHLPLTVDKYQLFGFDRAIAYIKEGKRVSRKVWKEKAFVFAGLASVETSTTEINKQGQKYATSKSAAEVFNVYYNGLSLCLKNSKNTIEVGYSPSQDDIFSEDWFLI